MPVLWHAGLFVGAVFNLHDASFSRLPGVPSCCPEYKTGDGLRFMIGGSFAIPVTQELGLGLAIRYADLGGDLDADETSVVYDGVQSVDATFGHSLKSSLHRLLIEPIGLYKPTEHLRVFAGPQFGISVKSSFQQEERILSPSTIRFENDRRVRMQYSGSITGAASLGIGIVGGIGYELPWRSDDLRLVPEIAGRYSLTDAADGVNWKVHGVSIGLSAVYIRSERRPEPTVPKPREPTYLLPPVEADREPSGAGL